MEVLQETVIDSLKLLPFLFAAYLAIEFIEDRAEEKTVALVRRAGKWGPILGSLLGLVPQCGLSAAASNLYAGSLITRGTLIAIFLSTSDEMLPILLSHSVPSALIIRVLAFKLFAGILIGILVDVVEGKLGRRAHHSIHEMCEKEDCHCEDGIVKSAMRHTVKIFLFIFAVSLVFGLIVESVGVEALGSFILNQPVIGEIVAGLIGLIPNCAPSVILTSLYLQGGMTGGAMISGLLVGSGVGLLVLFRMNHNTKDTFRTLGILYGSGVLLGILSNLIGLFA